jgi:hypothetical protein
MNKTTLDEIFDNCHHYGEPKVIYDLVEEIRLFRTIVERSIHIINAVDMMDTSHTCPSKTAILKIEKTLRHGLRLSRDQS